MKRRQSVDIFGNRSKITIRDGGNVAHVFSNHIALILMSLFCGAMFPPIWLIAGLFALSLPFALIRQVRGIVIEKNGNISFPGVFRRQRLFVGDITDANAESKTVGGAVAALATLNENNKKVSKTKLYFANLSGVFGSKQIRFSDKRKRDQFFGVLHQMAPDARITRFT